ncbi:hypothetical protein M405DRAFT_839464 [Rhizopogon salebrosus TDB-379]|nr:hypothetical protein M405DRAFT_839464 [Rhizopogon salebrosus TDB-379]
MKWTVEKGIGVLVVLRNGIHVVSPEGEHASPTGALDAEYLAAMGPLDSHSGAIHLSTLDVSPDNGILASGFMKSLYGTSPAGRNMATPSRAALISFVLDFLLLVQVWDLGQGSILFSSMATEASIGRAELVAHLDS